MELEPGGAAAHVKRRKRFLLKLPRAGRSSGEKLFEQLAGKIDKPDHRERPENAWIRPGTWALVDERAKLRHLQRLTRAEGRRLTRRIHAALKADRVERARQAGETVMGHLAGGDVKEAWRTLGGWYKAVTGKAAKPCYQRLERQTAERETLYAHVPPLAHGSPRTSSAPLKTTRRRAMRRSGPRCGPATTGGRGAGARCAQRT